MRIGSIFNQGLCVAVVLVLSACTGTSDIVAEDSSTLIGSAGYEKKLSDRGAVEARYLVTRGSASENSTVIQVDGERFSGLGGKNVFGLQTLSAHYRYNIVNGEKFKLTIAPGVQVSHLRIDTDLPEVSLSPRRTDFGVGLKLGMGYSISEKLSFEPEIAMAGQSREDRFTSIGAWLNYDFDKNKRLRIGYSTESFGDQFLSLAGGNNDGCLELEVPEGGVCADSDLKASASGLHVGFQYRH